MYHLKCSKKDVAARVLTCGDPDRVSLVARRLEGAELVNSHRGLLVYTGNYSGKRVTVATTGMGAPSAAIVNEELAMLGTKVLIRVGTTGAVAEGVELGDIIIPSEAVPLDGATQAYMRAGGVPKADSRLVEDLQGQLSKSKARFHVGKICTSDTFYLEEEKDAKIWSKRGVLSFEMECSVTFAIGCLRGYRAGAILAVTGKIYGEGKRVLEVQKARESIDLCITSALEVVIGTAV